VSFDEEIALECGGIMLSNGILKEQPGFIGIHYPTNTSKRTAVFENILIAEAFCGRIRDFGIALSCGLILRFGSEAQKKSIFLWWQGDAICSGAFTDLITSDLTVLSTGCEAW
jgi:hypothetical protein